MRLCWFDTLSISNFIIFQGEYRGLEIKIFICGAPKSLKSNFHIHVLTCEASTSYADQYQSATMAIQTIMKNGTEHEEEHDATHELSPLLVVPIDDPKNAK